ncbi:hypothetical protein C8T65DRAFT_751373 [Cerioporus squamosus]|nr:hypothetical protein C8T65DRAFT_751373 [Cerioporus squamosus]
MARRNNTRSRTNTGRQPQDGFVRPPPRHVVSNENDGTLSDRVGWVILHPDLVGHVSARLYKIPDALTLVETYRALSRAAPSYALLASYNERVGAPKSEKKYAAQVAQEAYQATIEAAERTIAITSFGPVASATILSEQRPQMRKKEATTSRTNRRPRTEDGDLLDIFARRGDYPTQDLLAIPSHTSYRTALGIDEEEVELWDILNQVSEDDILQQAIEMFDPVKVDSYTVHFIGA